jgi:hypothetical protein
MNRRKELEKRAGEKNRRKELEKRIGEKSRRNNTKEDTIFYGHATIINAR